MKISLLFLVLILTFQLEAQSYVLLSGKNSVQLSENSTTGFILSVHTGKLLLHRVKHDYQLFYQLSSEGYGSSLQEGAPELPVYRQLIELPLEAELDIRIVDTQYREISLSDKSLTAKIFPHQPPLSKNESYAAEFQYDRALYAQDKYFALPVVQGQVLGKLRGMRLARLSIAPVQYNPVANTLRVLSSIKIQVLFKHGNLAKTRALKQKTYAPSFDLMKRFSLNSRGFLLPVGTQQYAEKYVIVSDSVYRQTLRPFIRWKSRQGYKVITAWLQDSAVGSTRQSIKSYLQGLYANATVADPAPSYVLFVGDVNDIDPWPGQAGGNHITDLYYCEFTNDEFPEMYYGRFSVDDSTQLHNIIEKTLEYEQYLMPDPSYLDTAVLIAGYDASHGATYGNGQVNYGTSNYYNTSHGIVCKTYLYPNSSSQATQIRQDASDGASLLNYSAHGNYNGWSSPAFKNSDVASLTNAHKYPVMIGNACLTGHFNSNDCFGEVLTNAYQKGAVAYIGASDNTYWDEDFYWAVGYTSISSNPSYSGSGPGIFDGIFHDHGEPFSQWSMTMAQISGKGNMAVTQSGSKVRYYWEAYHVFGDPSLMPYSYVPQSVSPSYTPYLPLGINTLAVGAPAHALVALSIRDSLISSAVADSLGQALLSFDPLMQPDTATLVITGQNMAPYTASIPVLSPNGPYVMLSDYEYSDSLGNGDGLADYGEQLWVDMQLSNITAHAAGGLTLKLRTTDTNVVLVDSTAVFALLTGHDTVRIADAFAFDVKATVPDGHVVPFVCYIEDTASNSWSWPLTVVLHAPLLQAGALIMDDHLGNADGKADAGETLIFQVPVINRGSVDAPNCTVTMSSVKGLISMSPGAQLSMVKADSVVYAQFTGVVSSTATSGLVEQMAFQAQSGSYGTTNTYYQMIGSVDEDFETGDFSKFHWTAPNTYAWKIDKQQVFEGMYAAKSDSIGDEDTSGLMVSMNVLADDSISFYRMVSSEAGYDMLKFYIDDQLMKSWSGNVPWAQERYAVSAGTHTFKWLYIKDYYMNDGMDAAWVDYIAFPATDALTFIKEDPALLGKSSIFPNPADGRATIAYRLLSSSQVRVSLLDGQGRLIRRLDDRSRQQAGSYRLSFETAELENGLYFVSLETDHERRLLKLMLVHP